MGYQTALKEAKQKDYNIRIAAKIKNSSHEVLLIKRSANDNYSGVWEIPGGAVEKGETLLQALKREVSEETGLQLKKIKRFIKYFDFENIETGKTTRKFCFEILAQGNINISFEHQNFRWFSTPEINKLKVSDGTGQYDIWPDHYEIAIQ